MPDVQFSIKGKHQTIEQIVDPFSIPFPYNMGIIGIVMQQ
jgi:hypothetical protein